MKPTERNALLHTLQLRFNDNIARHHGIAWTHVLAKRDDQPDALRSLREMERSGGEPDVVTLSDSTNGLTFVDCSAESPLGRRSSCYDRAALDSRKENKPAHSAMAMAVEMGIDVLNEEHYRALQQLGTFDTQTSSWLHTPPEMRTLSGALFGDRRYGRVFVYHNGASSYYAGRGFRGVLCL